ncbi:MAG: DUF4399 domain-containing protein [Chitinophagales bacterium]
MKKKLFFVTVSFMALAACNNSGKESMNMDTTNAPSLPPVPEGAKVFFKSPKDGDTVTSPFKVEMGTEGIKVDTAGPVVAGSGHHHLFVDAEDSLMAGTMVPKDPTHLHFGKGQMETELKLAPGKHKLTLQFADGLHRSYGSKLSSTITVNVKK